MATVSRSPGGGTGGGFGTCRTRNSTASDSYLANSPAFSAAAVSRMMVTSISLSLAVSGPNALPSFATSGCGLSPPVPDVVSMSVTAPPGPGSTSAATVTVFPSEVISSPGCTAFPLTRTAAILGGGGTNGTDTVAVTAAAKASADS